MYILHFEYGYSARKIADLKKVNRNTVNGDIAYWYSKITKNHLIFNPESIIIITTERLDLQRTRLREYLDKAATIKEKLPIERLIIEIDSKLTNIHLRVLESTKRVYDRGIGYINEYLKSTNHSERYISFWDSIKVSEKAKQKIEKIIKEDEKKLWSREN